MQCEKGDIKTVGHTIMNQILHTLSSGAAVIALATFTFLAAALISLTILGFGLIGAVRMKTTPVLSRHHSGVGRVSQGDLAGHTVIETDYRVIL